VREKVLTYIRNLMTGPSFKLGAVASSAFTPGDLPSHWQVSPTKMSTAIEITTANK
jgi:hypothetical protein